MPEIALSGKLKVTETVEPPVGQREDPAVLAEASLAAAIGLPAVAVPDADPVVSGAEIQQRPASTHRVSARPAIKQAATVEVPFTPTQVRTAPVRATSRTLGYVVFVTVAILLAAMTSAVVFSLTAVGDVAASSPAMWSLFVDFSRLLSLRF